MRVSTVALHHFCKRVRPGSGHACRSRRCPAQRGSSARRAAAPGETMPPKPARATAAASPFFSTRTQFAGAFLSGCRRLMDWLATAEDCFADDYGSLRQGLLTSIFSLVIGMERIFHRDEMEDLGFARLCGGRQLSVAAHGRRLAAASVTGTRSMPVCRPPPVPGTCSRNEDAAGELRRAHHPALDAEIPHRQRLQHTTRNKYMRCEKLFTGWATWPAADFPMRGGTRAT